MSKADRSDIDTSEATPGRAWLMGVAAWLVPGSGHLLQGRWRRGILLGGAIWICLIAGLWMGGHMYWLDSNDPGSSVYLQLPPMIANLGTGVLYVGCWLLGIGFSDDPSLAARSTFEYGNTFLLIAGLLNYLIMLDAFDIAAGRKS